MKKTLSIVLVLCMTGAARSEFLKPEVEARLMYLIDQYTIRVGHSAPNPGIFLDYAQTNKIALNDVYNVVQRYAEDRYGKMAAETVESPQTTQNEHNFCQILVFIGETRDPRWIPFFRKIYPFPDKTVRAVIARSYIDLVGADAIGLLEDGFADQDFESRSHHMLYRRMQAQLKTASTEGRKKILGFFLRRMEKTLGTSRRKEIDQILANNFPEYRTSIQRKGYADWFLTSDFEFARKHGGDMILEIEKVPPEQRKDLSDFLVKSANEGNAK